MATYVLVHGATAGGWQMRGVASILRAKGHEVYTPTLTGLGERSHLLSPGIDLETHVRDILGVLYSGCSIRKTSATRYSSARATSGW